MMYFMRKLLQIVLVLAAVPAYAWNVGTEGWYHSSFIPYEIKVATPATVFQMSCGSCFALLRVLPAGVSLLSLVLCFHYISVSKALLFYTTSQSRWEKVIG